MSEVIRESPFKITPVGLEIVRAPTWEEWEVAGANMKEMLHSIHWILGDWLNLGERLFPEQYAQVLDASGFSLKTLQNDRWVAGRIDKGRRRPELSHAHHAMVAGLDPPVQEALLEDARDRDLTVRQLLERVRAHKISLRKETAAGESPASEPIITADGEILPPVALFDGPTPGPAKVQLEKLSIQEAAHTLDPDSFDLILVDIPYSEDTLHLYTPLAKMAGKLLKPGGSLCVYVAQAAVGPVWTEFAYYLRPWWMLYSPNVACLWEGKRVRSQWRPVLWFVKGSRRDAEIVEDLASGPLDEAIIRSLTVPGESVLGPLCGLGHHLDVAVRLGRNVTAFDPDPLMLEATRVRLEGGNHGRGD